MKWESGIGGGSWGRYIMYLRVADCSSGEKMAVWQKKTSESFVGSEIMHTFAVVFETRPTCKA